MANATKKPWSYSTGEWGVNRVRAFERQGKGIFLEFRERNPDGTAGRKARIALGHSDRKAAKAKAEEVAAAFRREEPAQGSEATLQVLFDTYGSEVTPEKGESKRKHDVRCAEMFLRYFGAQTLPRTLTRREWDRFVTDRRRGAIASAGVVQKRRVGDHIRPQVAPVRLQLGHDGRRWARRIPAGSEPVQGAAPAADGKPAALGADPRAVPGALRHRRGRWRRSLTWRWCWRTRRGTGSAPSASCAGPTSTSMPAPCTGGASWTRSGWSTPRSSRRRPTPHSGRNGSTGRQSRTPDCSRRPEIRTSRLPGTWSATGGSGRQSWPTCPRASGSAGTPSAASGRRR